MKSSQNLKKTVLPIHACKRYICLTMIFMEAISEVKIRRFPYENCFGAGNRKISVPASSQ